MFVYLQKGACTFAGPLAAVASCSGSELLNTQRACQNSRQAIVNRLSCIAHVVGQEEQRLSENNRPIGRA